MKNEILAQALTNIDDALIAEADERRTRGAKITARSLAQNIYRYGAVAACLILAIGVLIAGNIGGQDVLLYGESIADSPRTVAEYMPLRLKISAFPSNLNSKRKQSSRSLPAQCSFLTKTAKQFTKATNLLQAEAFRSLLPFPVMLRNSLSRLIAHTISCSSPIRIRESGTLT